MYFSSNNCVLTSFLVSKLLPLISLLVNRSVLSQFLRQVSRGLELCNSLGPLDWVPATIHTCPWCNSAFSLQPRVFSLQPRAQTPWHTNLILVPCWGFPGSCPISHKSSLSPLLFFLLSLILLNPRGTQKPFRMYLESSEAEPPVLRFLCSLKDGRLG